MAKDFKISGEIFDDDTLLRKQKSILRKLRASANESFIPKRIAILSGSTVNDIKNLTEIFLLNEKILPTFYESEYNKFYEDAVFGNETLDEFNPEIVIIFTGTVNILNRPEIFDTPEEVEEKLNAEYRRFETVWKKLSEKFSAVIIQNNFDMPHTRPEGNFDSVFPGGLQRFVARLNEKFAEYAEKNSGFYIHDINRLSAEIGLNRWHNRAQYYAYKFAVNYDVIPEVAKSLKKITCAVLGKVKKCLVLDLDNTLWGGIIGESGAAGISIGHETATGEAYEEFQNYVKNLKERGIILAVCSKNDEEVAKTGFSHPSGVLKLDDFAIFVANWEPKNLNIKRISEELNIGLADMVFIDDNPAERELIRQTLPEVAVPEINPDDVFSYIRAIEDEGYFEIVAVSGEDRQRTEFYRANRQRKTAAENFADYDEFLKSLEMSAEVGAFTEIYFDRIAQLTNKTNQFNLTTRRFTREEIRKIAEDKNFVTLYCRLKDKFGDNGIVSLIIAEKKNSALHINLWLMSCRVLKRDVENFMLNNLVERARKSGAAELVGYWFRTKKNGQVKDLYKNFGFEKVSEDENSGVWSLKLSDSVPQKNFIRLEEKKV